MNKQSTKPIFIEMLRMWNWSQMVPVDSLGQRDMKGWVGLRKGGKAGDCLLKDWEVAAFAK